MRRWFSFLLIATLLGLPGFSGAVEAAAKPAKRTHRRHKVVTLTTGNSTFYQQSPHAKKARAPSRARASHRRPRK
jgi:hypothetical protein